MFGLYAACGTSSQPNVKIWLWLAFATCGRALSWSRNTLRLPWPVNGLFSNRSIVLYIGLPWLFHPAVTTRNTISLSNPTRCRAKLFRVDIRLWHRCGMLTRVNPRFTHRMTYSVLSICSTNHFSGFSSSFLQMKREVDGISNMLFWDCHREHHWYLSLSASNAKPHSISGRQLWKLQNWKLAGRWVQFKLLLWLYEV